MKYFILTIIALLCFHQNRVQSQVPISSIYKNLKNEKSNNITPIYLLLDKYYSGAINAKQLQAHLSKINNCRASRDLAILEMAKSYTEIDNAEMGFFHIRSAVNHAVSLSDYDIVKGIVYAEFANYLYAREAHDIAIEFFRKSVPILDTYKPSENEGSGYNLLNKMSRSFEALGEQDSVNLYMNKIITYASLYKNKLWLSSAYNNKGYRFYQSMQLDSASKYYRLAQVLLDTTNEDHLIFYENINENFAHIFAKEEKYDQAILLLENVINIRCRYAKEVGGAISALNYYMDYCIKSGQRNEAINKVNQCEPLLSRFGIDYTTSSKYLQLKMKLANLQGHTQEYFQYYQKMLDIEKANISHEAQLIANRKGINNYIKARNELFEQKLKIEKLEKQKLQQLITILIILSSFIGYGIYLIGKYKKKLLQVENEKLLQREKILHLENSNLKYSIELKQKDISKVVADNKLRTDIKKEFIKKLNQLNFIEADKIKFAIKKLSIDLEQTIDNHEKINLLQTSIEELNAEFESKLRLRIPLITQSEIEICSLIKLGYNNTDISNIVNKSPENVRINKFRIKQKAGLDTMSALEQLLKDL